MSNIVIHSSNLENLDIGTLGAKWSARGDRILRYYIDIRHKKMNIHKEVSAPELFILQSKVDALMASWDEKYTKYLISLALTQGKDSADELTADAIRAQDAIAAILENTLNVDDSINWEALKDRGAYDMPKSFPDPKPHSTAEKEPVYSDPPITWIDILLGRKARLIEEASEDFSERVRAWEQREEKRKAKHATAIQEWENRQSKFWADHAVKKRLFEEEQAAAHKKIDELRDEVKLGNPEAVMEQVSMVLENSDYDGLFEKSYDLDYQVEGKLLLLEYDLPGPDDLPDSKSFRFVKATGELKETKISAAQKKANFDSATYQICLRTIHELFESDVDQNIDQILFNGFVNFVDPATGMDNRACILSILVDRAAFDQIDLARVEAKACFKSLKGVSAASLAKLTPIPPIMVLNKDDRRFVDGVNVTADFDESTNLAAISWEEFEHLVRELFEKEFSDRGGEVKVTQASRDGGVDAVAFDPDPITGGKIVIQAKRYTRTVGVSAVRDLFGTVMNEGAAKGILVTTADYGPDAYKFASDKPLTLMNGANLLHLLGRHGVKAKIDLAEARSARE